MKMEIVSLRALLKTSRNTIASLQEQLGKREDESEDDSRPPSIVLGNQWKMSGRQQAQNPTMTSSMVCR